MRSIVFNKAGKIALTKYVAGALSHVPANMCIRNGTVESIEESVSYNSHEMPDGNSDWPMGDYDIGVSGNIVITLSSYQAELYAFLIGTSVDDLTDESMRVNDKPYTVPESSPYTVQLGHTPNDEITPIVLDVENSSFANVEDTPDPLEFSITDDTITFNSADAGKEVFVTYEWTSPEVSGISLETTSNRPVVHAVISGEAISEDESVTYDANVRVDKCKAVGDIKPPKKQREGQPWSFTLKVLKPRGSNDAVKSTFAEQS